MGYKKRDLVSVRLLYSLILLLSAASFTACFGIAAPTGGNVTAGLTEHGNNSVSGTVVAMGGNVTQVNLSGTQMSVRWAGFYGFISGGIQLSDQQANKFYEWTVTNFTGAVVYASNSTVGIWDLRAMNASVAPYLVTTPGSDDYNHTFTSAAAFQSATLGPIAATPYARTFQNGVVGALRTYGLVTSDNAVNIWAGVAISNTSSFKAGQQVDYQLLVPASASGLQYNFYLELP